MPARQAHADHTVAKGSSLPLIDIAPAGSMPRQVLHAQEAQRRNVLDCQCLDRQCLKSVWVLECPYFKVSGFEHRRMSNKGYGASSISSNRPSRHRPPLQPASALYADIKVAWNHNRQHICPTGPRQRGGQFAKSHCERPIASGLTH